MSECRCRLSDLRNLREALRYSQVGLAELLAVDRHTVWEAEQQPHHCMRPSTVKLFRAYLATPEFVERLANAGYPHPFPEDLAGDDASTVPGSP